MGFGAIRKNASDTSGLSDRQRRMYDFLQDHPEGVLCSVDPNGSPHGVVVYYALDINFTVHVLTKKGTRKYDNIMHNPHVMFVVFDQPAQTTVQITGIATEHGNAADVNEVADRILDIAMQDKAGDVPPIAKLEAGDFTTLEIEPRQVRMAAYAQPESGGYKDLFESIESFELQVGVK